MTDSLEEMIRRRQDEIRGRPELLRERLSRWFKTADLEFGLLMTVMIPALILLIGVLVAACFSMWGHVPRPV